MFNHTQLSDCCANPTHIILDPHKIFPLYPHYGSFISPNPLLCTFRQRLLRDRRASDFRAGLRRFLAKAGVKSLGVPLGPVKITISKLPWLLEIWPIPVVSRILVMNYGEKHGTYIIWKMKIFIAMVNMVAATAANPQRAKLHAFCSARVRSCSDNR